MKNYITLIQPYEYLKDFDQTASILLNNGYNLRHTTSYMDIEGHNFHVATFICDDAPITEYYLIKGRSSKYYVIDILKDANLVRIIRTTNISKPTMVFRMKETHEVLVGKWIEDLTPAERAVYHPRIEEGVVDENGCTWKLDEIDII